MSFDRPWWLIGLIIVPVLAYLWQMQERRRAADAARFTNTALIPNLVPARPGRRRYIPLALLLLALAAARKAATAFLSRVPKDYSIAVVGFGTRAYVALPPTTDRVLAQDALASLNPSEGTAIGDAVLISVRLATKQRTSDGVVPPASVLLISDGARDGGTVDPLAAARFARSRGIPISTVLVGTQAGIVTNKLVGGYEEQIRVPPSPTTLQQIARLSKGQFYRARTSEALTQVYKKLATRIGHRTKSREISDFFADGAAALLLAGGGLSALWYRRVIP